MASIDLEKHDINTRESTRFLVLVSRLPSLIDCLVTKQTFCIVLLRLFSFKFRRFLSTVGLSDEDNCCKSQGIGKLIKETPWKGIFEVDWLINVAANTQISSSSLLTSANSRQPFFTRVLFGVLFFSRNHTWKMGVQLIHEWVLYTSLYGNSYLPPRFSKSDSTTIVTGSDI